jgi:hypothetical protein
MEAMEPAAADVTDATETAAESVVAGSGPSRRLYSVPLVIGVTGHRDLVPDELSAIRGRVRRFLVQLRKQYPDRDLTVMSALAEGADHLVAEEVLDLRLPLTVVLPMPRECYVEDFVDPEARRAFERLCAAATDLFELPITPGNTIASIRGAGPNRARQYAQLGVFLSAHCHILLALWDGKHSDDLGGTAQVVRFHQDDLMPGYTPRATASRLTLTDDESDLVYHVVCSRQRANGTPEAGLAPLDAWWFTRDESEPRTRDLPPRYRQIFDRTDEFNRDMSRFAEGIAHGGWPLLPQDWRSFLPKGLKDIDEICTAADWLANRYQKRTLWTLRVVHAFVLLIGITYVSYTDLGGNRLLLFVLIGLMVAAGGVGYAATRGAWHRKYLDYRTLAEGLRVQFYWAAAGVTSGNVTKFAHDNFLQTQDPDLGWIRNVMRVTGTECDVEPSADARGLEFAIREWIGDERGGQLGYFRRKTALRTAHRRATNRLSGLGLMASVVTLVLLLFVGAGVPEFVRQPLVYGVGCALLLIGIRQSYAKATGESEIIKQYEFMLRIFGNARRRIEGADSDSERRRVLKILGDAALEEHAQWILMFRQRSVDPREVVRLS